MFQKNKATFTDSKGKKHTMFFSGHSLKSSYYYAKKFFDSNITKYPDLKVYNRNPSIFGDMWLLDKTLCK
jgi:hypothetical protein